MQWSVVPSPNPQQDFLLSLYGVTDISASDIWAVGYYQPAFGSSYETLTLHWDGSQWSIIASPNNNGDDVLQSVSAASTNDVWAVGSNGTTQTLAEHWNGTQWSLVKSPNKSHFDELYGVAAVSSTDVWAVGDQATAYLQPGKTLIEHWDGTTWHIVKSPDVGMTTQYHTLLGVSAISSSAIMAVGFFGDNNYLAPKNSHTMSEYWDGTKWQPHKGANQPVC